MSQDTPTKKEAIRYIVEDFSEEELRYQRDVFSYFEPTDVLYYADAYGDLEMAVVLQRFDKTLPSAIHKRLYQEYREGGLDVLDMANTMDIESCECPVCGREIYEFEFPNHHTEYINEYGEVTDVVYLSDSTSEYYHPEQNTMMCRWCRESFPWEGDRIGNVRIHIPEGMDFNYEDEITGFTVCGGVIRHDDYYQERRSLWVPLPDVSNSFSLEQLAIERAKSLNSARELLSENDWVEVEYPDFARHSTRYGADVRFKHAFREIVSKWAQSDYEIHPDIEVPYMMIDGKYLFTTEGGFDQVYEAVADELRQGGLDPSSKDEVTA